MIPAAPLIWAGDLNVAPEPKDVYDPKRMEGHVCFHPREREALAEIKEWGLIDVFRLHNKEAKQYTFWDYLSAQSTGTKSGLAVGPHFGDPSARGRLSGGMDRFRSTGDAETFRSYVSGGRLRAVIVQPALRETPAKRT